jgi:hypothetical protein
VRALIKKVYDFLYFQTWNFGLWSPPDRRFLVSNLFKHFSKSSDIRRILFVGVRRYTKSYEKKFSRKQKFITIDYDKAVEKFGARQHIVGDVRLCGCHVSDSAEKFDLIFLNGIIGYGLDDAESADAGLAALASVMNPNAWLVIGNHPLKSKFVNLHQLSTMVSSFTPTVFPPTGLQKHSFRLPTYPGIHHEYRFYRRL